MGDSPPAPVTAAARRRANPVIVASSALVLLVPVVLGLAVPLYQSVTPRLLGIPFSYWFQMSMAILAAIATSTVYRLLFADDRDGGAA